MQKGLNEYCGKWDILCQDKRDLIMFVMGKGTLHISMKLDLVVLMVTSKCITLRTFTLVCKQYNIIEYYQTLLTQ